MCCEKLTLNNTQLTKIYLCAVLHNRIESPENLKQFIEEQIVIVLVNGFAFFYEVQPRIS